MFEEAKKKTAKNVSPKSTRLQLGYMLRQSRYIWLMDDQDEDEPEDQSEDQDADADEPEDQSEDQSEGD